MAFASRTTAEIYRSIMDEINNQTALNSIARIDSEQTLLQDLKKKSKVAMFRIFAWHIAYIIHIFEANLGNFYEEILKISDKNIIGTAKWLVEQALKFQDGDIIKLNESNTQLEYEEEDESKRIITNAAVVEAGDRVILKVKKKDNKLTSGELERFNHYINQIKMVGTTIQVRSVNPDKLTLNMNIVYDGQRDLNSVKGEVESVIEEYINNIGFNDTIRQIDIIDNIQKIEGILDVHFLQSTGEPTVGAKQDWIYTYDTFAGWAKISEDNPLSDTISYQAKKQY